MTPEQKIKHLVLIRDAELRDVPPHEHITSKNVDQFYDEIVDSWDALQEVREGEFVTNLPAESSRHYESKSVAAKARDGSWIGWTYWYGGGKHGQPEGVEWMDGAYDLAVTEEEKTVTVRTFTKMETA